MRAADDAGTAGCAGDATLCFLWMRAVDAGDAGWGFGPCFGLDFVAGDRRISCMCALCLHFGLAFCMH